MFLSYHLSAMMITQHLFLPTPDGIPFGNLNEQFSITSYTWHFSTKGLPLTPITKRYRELLPHIFTLIPTASHKDGYFLWHSFLFCTLRQACLSADRLSVTKQPVVNRCIALSCPDFPPRINTKRQPADRNVKVSRFIFINEKALRLSSNTIKHHLYAVRLQLAHRKAVLFLFKRPAKKGFSSTQAQPFGCISLISNKPKML